MKSFIKGIHGETHVTCFKLKLGNTQDRSEEYKSKYFEWNNIKE